MRYVCWLMLLLLMTIPHREVRAQELSSLALMADDKLSLPMAEIIRAYSSKHAMAISAAFLGVKDDALLVTEGAYADIFITAHEARLNLLKEQGVVNLQSEQSVARNRLVLVGPDNANPNVNLSHGFPLAALINAMEKEPLLAIGNPETLEEGSKARLVLHRMDVSADLEPYTIYLRELTQIVRLISTQGAYAILYISDAVRYPDIVKVLGTFPQDTYTPVVYKAVVLAGNKMKDAENFIQFLKSAEAQTIFKKYGVALAN